MNQTVLMYELKKPKQPTKTKKKQTQNTNHTHNLRPPWSSFSEKSQKIKS